MTIEKFCRERCPAGQVKELAQVENMGKAHAARNVIYIEPFSGISGDMLLGALLDLGVELTELKTQLSLLPLSGYEISQNRCQREGIQAAKFNVKCAGHADHSHGHRAYREIRTLIETSLLPDRVKHKSLEAFGNLAAAEGRIHNCPPDDVHFHEVGAVDSIVDIVGAAVAFDLVGPARVVSAPVNVGQGSLTCRHGIYPAPGPATLELLKGIPVYANEVQGELTTPTGAALLAAFAESFGPRPALRVARIGYGARDREIKGAANVLRLTLGEEAVRGAVDSAAEEVAVIEATLDDMNPQVYGHFQEAAFAAGALDVFIVAAQMKKNRPGLLLSVVCQPERVDELASLIFAETTTIGLRYTFASRKTLAREFLEVETEFGPITIKVSSLAGQRMNFAPEYECCRRIAHEKGVPLKEVMAAASRAYLELAK